MGVKPSTFGPFIKGVDSSTGVLTQPKGSIPRGSNLLLSKRGSLRTCDGSGMVNAYNGVPTAGRGRDMCDFFFAPTGVAGYYLRLMKALDQHLGAPKNLAASLTTSGTLTVAQAYYWVVTAVDGTGGETPASNEVTLTPSGGNRTASLTWNQVPNAAAYNIYRGTTSGGELLLVGVGLPVGINSYTDTGLAVSNAAPISIASITCVSLATSFPSGNISVTVSVVFNSPIANNYQSSQSLIYVAGSDSNFNSIPFLVSSITSNSSLTAGHTFASSSPIHLFESSTAGTIAVQTSIPPVVDTTQQTALYAMPPAALGVPYTNANIVALFPADPPMQLDGGGGGGGGGGRGGNQGGDGGQQGSTPAGGVAGNVSLIPQIVQFTNQAVLALGNGFPPQVYSDPNGTPTNPAKTVAMAGISVDANGVVTVTTAAHGINLTQGIGANVIIFGVSDPAYNTNGNGASAFTTIALPGANQVKIVNLNALGHGASSGGFMTVSTIPVISNFVPAYPAWTATVNYAVNSIVVPTVSNGHYYKAIQGGTSGGTQPTFVTGTGQRVLDGSVVWQESGLLNTAAPPPPGGAHLAVFSGSLWVFNTSVLNTATGLDGPCSMRMSDVNNLNSWNPINQAFLDKDDGTEGMGLASFTIAAQGIPPEGSLCAFKKKAVYQIVGVFGASNFQIQRVQTDMGTIAPRTLQFVPGFGIVRLTYLGFAVFDGVNDRIISTQVEPYLVGSNDPDNADIAVIDQQWQAVSQSSLAANPPMYCTAIPVGTPGTSNGALTRIMCFDLVLKAWGIVDLPFPVSTMLGVVTVSTIAITLFGSFSDGTLQRWQAGDVTWATSASGSDAPAKVVWSMRTPTCSSRDAAERLYIRRVAVVGQNTAASPSTMTIEIRNGGTSLGVQNIAMPSGGDIQVTAAGGSTGRRFDANISGVGLVTIDSLSFDLVPRPVGVQAGAIA